MIPTIIHQVWIQGYEHLSVDILKQINHMRKLNPTWEYVLWDDIRIQQLLQKYPIILNKYLNAERLTGMANPLATKSDIARYVIMKEYGGLYLDVDFWCVKSFDGIFGDADIYIASAEIGFIKWIYPGRKPKYCACCMAFTPNHPVWNNIFNRIRNTGSKFEIGSALDFELQRNKYPITELNQFISQYACDKKNGICFTPTESSWNTFRPALKFINCNYRTIILIIILVLWTR